MKPRGWHRRGYLPHFDGGEVTQFITFNLADAIPPQLVRRWREELELTANEERYRLLHRRVEKYLDLGHGRCYLRRSDIAEMVQRALLFQDNASYLLIAWVVMPNHVHVLIHVWDWPLAKLLHSIS